MEKKKCNHTVMLMDAKATGGKANIMMIKGRLIYEDLTAEPTEVPLSNGETAKTYPGCCMVPHYCPYCGEALVHEKLADPNETEFWVDDKHGTAGTSNTPSGGAKPIIN